MIEKEVGSLYVVPISGCVSVSGQTDEKVEKFEVTWCLYMSINLIN